MTALHQIIKSLQAASGSNAKLAILQEHKDDELLKAYMKAVYDPGISYYISKAPVTSAWNITTLDKEFLKWIVENIADRVYTGDNAKSQLKSALAAMDVEGQELAALLIKRSIGAGIGETMILKTWPGLFFTVPYQRCSLLDDKAKERFNQRERIAIQEKCDGSFLYLVKEAGKDAEAITRAGSKYPKEFTQALAEGIPDGVALIGELLVFTNPMYTGKQDVLDRQTGNGILNSVLKGGEVNPTFVYKMYAWDILTVAEFHAGKSVHGYEKRLTKMDFLRSNTIPCVQALQTEWVTSLAEAYDINSKFTAAGLEGSVVKTPDFIWKDGTSKDCVKLKVSFEVDLEITDVIEGEGKAAGMMGALSLKSSDGKLATDVGTGLSDIQRIALWTLKDEMIGKIVTIKANDIISNRNNDGKSLFLPVFIEERLDKTIADTYDHCVAQLEAAKGN